MSSILLETVALAGPEIVTGISQGIRARKAKGRLETAEAQMKQIMDEREAPVNPFAGVTNPYQNMGVATQAAEMQAQQTDQALANTLDTLRATGTSAGGATALARAAAQSKQGVAASIEAQEATNQKLIADGAQMQQKLFGVGEQDRLEQQERFRDEKIGYQERLADRAYVEQINFANRATENLTGATSSIMGQLPPVFDALNNLQLGGTAGATSPYNPNDAFDDIGKLKSTTIDLGQGPSLFP